MRRPSRIARRASIVQGARWTAFALTLACGVARPPCLSSAASTGPIERPAERTVLRVAYEDTHNFPYHLGVGDRVPESDPGISVDLVRSAAERLGLRVRFERLPWRRCLRSLGRNEVDAVFNASFRRDRMATARYPMQGTEPDRARRIMTTHYAFYRLPISAVRWDGQHLFLERDGRRDDFAGPVGSVNGYSVSALLREAGYTVDDAGTRNSLLSLRKLLRGRVPLIVDAEPRMRWFQGIDPRRFGDIVEMRPPVFERDYYLVLSPAFVAAHGVLAERLWDEIEALRESPEMARRYARYDSLLAASSASNAELAP